MTDHADDIDFDLPAKFLDRQFKQRTGNGDAGVVDQTERASRRRAHAHLGRGGLHRGFIGHVEE